MNPPSDESRYIAPAFAYPQGGPSSHALNEQPDHHPTTTNPSAEQSPYHAADSGTSSNMNDYHQLTSSNHDLGPYSSPLINSPWPSNDIHQPPVSFPGGVSEVVISDDSHHSSQTRISNWEYQYQFDHERGEQPTSSLPYPAQPPPNQHWPIESGMLGPVSNGNFASFSVTAVHGTQAQTSPWMYTHPPPVPQTYPTIGYSGSQPPVAQDATTTTPYLENVTAASSNASPSLPGADLDKFRTPNAPRSNPFSSFPAEDSLRDLNYYQSSDYGQQTNDQLLGVRVPPSHDERGSTHSHHPPMVPELLTPFLPTSNSTSATQFGQVESESRSDQEAAQEKYFKTCFPNDPKLQKSALELSKKAWLRSNESEPPLDNEGGQPVGAPASRFEPFFEANGSHRCLFFENGKRCSHAAPRKERALGHARGHFDYKPFYCESKCGKTNCTHKYHCQSALKDHIRRRGNPERECEICGRQISAQNIRRHRNTHGSKAQSELPTSPSQDMAPKRSKFKRVVTSIGKAIRRTLSRSPSPSKQ